MTAVVCAANYRVLLCGRDNAPLVTSAANLKYESFKGNLVKKMSTQFDKQKLELVLGSPCFTLFLHFSNKYGLFLLVFSDLGGTGDCI